jgi:hypothetical protein
VLSVDRRVARRESSSHHELCYLVTVALRYVALAGTAALVLGLAVYLFFEVRAQPARAEAPERAPTARVAREPAVSRVEPAHAAREREIDAEAGSGAGVSRAPTLADAPRSFGSIIRKQPRGPDGEPTELAPHKLDAIMAEANKAYDRGDLDEAKAIARKVLQTSPDNVRMLRVVVSASCIAGDTADAQASYVLLPAFDREQMKTRCARYGVSFTDP